MLSDHDRAEALAEKIRQGEDITETEMVEALGTADRGGVLYYTMLSMVREQRSLAKLPETLKEIIRTEAWRRWRWVGQEFGRNSLGEYLTLSPPNGIGVTLDMVEKLIAGDKEAEALWREQTTAKKGTNQYTKEDGDNITIQPERGTSRAYTLARLKCERPDLYDQIKPGGLTANAAAIEAGWRKPPSSLKTLRKAWAKASEEERAAFLAEIAP